MWLQTGKLLLMELPEFLSLPPRNLFFTGKGGVGKTTTATATALHLASTGKQVLLVSTDPASNLDQVLEVELGSTPCPIPGAAGLAALNIDPEAAAHAYREKVVGPYRGILPDTALTSMEEQLSGACTLEIAAFDEFARLLADPATVSGYDHIVFDTAPTGHTLRLLELPAAWSDFFDENIGGTSCLGPLSGLQEQRKLYAETRAVLGDATKTVVIVVSRPEKTALDEAARASAELAALDVANQQLVINGVFKARDQSDPVARALQVRGDDALAMLPQALKRLPRCDLLLRAGRLIGIKNLQRFFAAEHLTPPAPVAGFTPPPGFTDLLQQLTTTGNGVVMTMGKGGVGKTTLAVALAMALAEAGHQVHLTTTDPAAHIRQTIGEIPVGLKISRIDPKAETEAYRQEVLATAGAGLDEQGLALLEEDLRSPCTEEVAVFRAFARVVDDGEGGYVVVDTAPTGHTLLLLDAAEAYHREVDRSSGELPSEVRKLLPRLRDPDFTRVLLVTLPEATPVQEALGLQEDLRRAGIEPFGWIVNQALSGHTLTDPVLLGRQAQEGPLIEKVFSQSQRCWLGRWQRAPVDALLGKG
jgi:arsenite-transporting ATPase